MKRPKRRIAINSGAGYVPGLNAVIAGAVLAGHELEWEVVGIRDGFDGLLFPERYPDGGLVSLRSEDAASISGCSAVVLGTAVRSDPFHVRTIDLENLVEEVDRSDALLKALQSEKIDAVISVVGTRALGILWKMNRKGLKTVAVPKSIENDVAATQLSFGFNSALSFTVEMLDRARQAAASARKIGIIEVPGESAGWLALQAGTAVCADVVLIPEIPYDLRKVAAKLAEKLKSGQPSALIVVAEGAVAVNGQPAPTEDASITGLKASLSPGAAGGESAYVIERAGYVAQNVALEIQRLTGHETHALVLDQLVRGGPPTAVDRQLGLAYGAGAVRALNNNQSGVMVSFQPPDLRFVPFAEAINKVRTVPAGSIFVQVARSLGISLGD